jgi:flagellar biosynthesis protein FliR
MASSGEVTPKTKLGGMIMLKLRSALFAAAVLIALPLISVLLLVTGALGESRLPPCQSLLSEGLWDNCQGILGLNENSTIRL